MSSLSLGEISKKIDATLIGDEDLLVKGIRESKSCKKEYICFVKDKKFLSSLSRSSGAVILEESLAHKIDFDTNLLIHSNPYLAYAKISNLFDVDDDIKIPFIHESAVISDKATIHKDVYIGPNVCIGPNCLVEQNVIIHSNCSLVKDVSIDSGTEIQNGTVLGSDGFGFAPTKDGYVKIKQLGKLKIGKNVEIGANCTIDRGAIDDTEIHDGVILDNLVHIAHNVILGQNSAIAASCAIAGSTKIGKNFQMGGLSGVLGHLDVCDNVTVGAHTLITKNITKPGNYIGIMPAQEHNDWAKSSVFIKKLSK